VALIVIGLLACQPQVRDPARPGNFVAAARGLALAFGTYALASVLLFGRDVVRSPASTVVGDDGADKTLYLWSLEWWPWAIRRGHNPLDVDVAWLPHGFDFGLGTGGAGLALAAAPLTALAGPIPTYNVLILLAPALAATGAFLLARRVTGAFWPSLVGGWIFGFSSYETGRILGHLPLASVALVPLALYLVLGRQMRDLSRRAFVSALAGVLAAQFLIVTQTLFSLVTLGACAAIVAILSLGGPAVRVTIRDSALALAVALFLISPVVLYALFSDAATPLRSPFSESADVLNYVVPTPRTWIRPPGSAAITDRFTGTGAEQGAYLSLPLLALALLALKRRPLPGSRRLLGVVLAIAALLSLGTRPKFAGVVFAIGPWSGIAPLPILGSALPARFTLYTALLAGLLAATALADRGSRLRWALAISGIVLTLPNLGLPQWSSPVQRPRFFETGQYRQHLVRGTTALVLPYGPAGWSMLWQAESGFRFNLIGGHFALRVTPAEREWRDAYERLNSGQLTPLRLRVFLTSHCVDIVLVTPGTRESARRAIEAAVAAPAVHASDSLIYPIERREFPTDSATAGREGACAAPSGAARR
jgi:hypothetical protein